jgi:hypothetical protein
MATNTGINTPTLSAAQWSALQVMQKKAQTFLQAATGAAAKSNLLEFQKAFNAALEAIKTSVMAHGGDAKAVAAMLGQTAGSEHIAEDGAWGPQSALAMVLVFWVSLTDQTTWKNMSYSLATEAVIYHQSGALPISRSQIASTWYPKWKTQVANLVYGSYSTAVIDQQAPQVNQANNNTAVTNAQSSQSNTTKQIDAAQGQNPAQTSTDLAFDDAPTVITTQRPQEKSLTWLWVTLGLGALGAGAWWMFGRKAR